MNNRNKDIIGNEFELPEDYLKFIQNIKASMTEINGKVAYDINATNKALLNLIEGSEYGDPIDTSYSDIKNGVLNEKNYARFQKALELSCFLCENITHAQIRCESNISYAEVRIRCNSFHFNSANDLGNEKRNTMKQFKEFLQSIDSFEAYLSAGSIDSGDIMLICFSVFDVWREKG